MKKYCIYGAGGFGCEVLCLLKDELKSDVKGLAVFMVDDEYYSNKEILGIEVIKRSSFDAEKYKVTVAIGEPSIRKEKVESLPDNTEYFNLIHPNVVMSEWVKLGKGVIITAGCILTCNIEVGDFVHLNLQTTVGHDSYLGNYFTSAPGVKVSGKCVFGSEVYIGTNASIKNEIKVCDNVTIGMGAVVIKDITEAGTYVGCPAKLI